MCGIAGFLAHVPPTHGEQVIRWMTRSLRHRGPDSGGIHHDPKSGWRLGFRRLAIRDLDSRADQPMVSRSGRTMLVFNGEIYNADQIAAKYLGGLALRTTGDTEVLLEAFERRGLSLLPELNGMFAFAALDTRSGRVTLARDRWGKKPLFVLQRPGLLAFASELRALRIFDLQPDPEQLPYYFHFGYFPAPTTFYRDVTQLCPGEYLIADTDHTITRKRYFAPWNLPWGGQNDWDAEELCELLVDAVRIRTVSDVPLGAFLSGGVDSSLVVTCLKTIEADHIPTFTIAFDDRRLNEAPYAAAVARHLGLPHKALFVADQRLSDLVLEYVDCYEQPFMDKSGLPSLVLCRAVRPYVTVALSGDGGDEFFGGYERYRWFMRALKWLRRPKSLRCGLGRVAAWCSRRRGERIRSWLTCDEPAALYAAIIRNWLPGPIQALLPDVREADERPVAVVRDVFAHVDAPPVLQAACFDATHYIPGDLQVKMDRASMRVSLEVRCPLLDPRVTEFGARLAPEIKFGRGLKTVLKAVLQRQLPRTLCNRPKRGFSVPMTDWLRGPLRSALIETLSDPLFRQCDWINHHVIGQVVRDFERGQAAFNGSIWMLFVLAHHVITASGSHPSQLRRVESPSYRRVLTGCAQEVAGSSPRGEPRSVPAGKITRPA